MLGLSQAGFAREGVQMLPCLPTEFCGRDASRRAWTGWIDAPAPFFVEPSSPQSQLPTRTSIFAISPNRTNGASGSKISVRGFWYQVNHSLPTYTEPPCKQTLSGIDPTPARGPSRAPVRTDA